MSKHSRTSAALNRITKARRDRAMARPELRTDGGKPKIDNEQLRKLIDDWLAKNSDPLPPA